MLHSLQCIINPAVIAGVLHRRSAEPENHCAVMIGGQLQKLLQVTHTLVGDQMLLVWGQGVHCPEGVSLKHRHRTRTEFINMFNMSRITGPPI